MPHTLPPNNVCGNRTSFSGGLVPARHEASCADGLELCGKHALWVIRGAVSRDKQPLRPLGNLALVLDGEDVRSDLKCPADEPQRCRLHLLINTDFRSVVSAQDQRDMR